MKYLSQSIILGAALMASCASNNGSFTLNQPSDTLTIVNISHAPKYALLPIEEEQPEAQGMLNGTPMDVRLAVNKVDYTVPFPPPRRRRARLARYQEPGTQCRGMEAHRAGRHLRHHEPREVSSHLPPHACVWLDE